MRAYASSRHVERKDDACEGFSRIETALCCFVFFMAPFESYVNVLFGSYLKYVILLAIGLILAFTLRRGRRLDFHWFVCLYFLWLTDKIATILWTNDTTVVGVHFISQLGMVGFLLLLCSLRPGRRQIGAMLVSLALGSLCFCIASLFASEPYMAYTQRFVLTIAGVQPDPNNAAALALPGAALCLYLFLTGKKRWQRMLYLIGVLISLYVVLMTGSRGNLLSLAAIAAAVICFQRRVSVGMRATYGLLIVAAALVVIAVIPPDTYARLFKVDSYGDGSGRTELWGIAWNAFLSSPVFGTGWGSMYEYADGTATHNTFLSMLAEQGIFGVLLFVMPICYVAVESIRRGEALPLMLILCCVMPALTIDAINKRFFWDALIMAILLLETPVSFPFREQLEEGSLEKAYAGRIRKKGMFA